MGDIGRPVRRITLEPFPDESVPEPERFTPAPEPAPLPAEEPA